MKKAYLIGLLVISLALGFTLWAFSSAMSPFVDLKTAHKTSGSVQVRGLILKNDPAHPSFFDSQTGTFRFWIVDKNKDTIEVYYRGGKPDAFDAAPGLSASGQITRDAAGHEFFNSDSLSVQCPSKYSDVKPDYTKKPAKQGGIF